MTTAAPAAYSLPQELELDWQNISPYRYRARSICGRFDMETVWRQGCQYTALTLDGHHVGDFLGFGEASDHAHYLVDAAFRR